MPDGIKYTEMFGCCGDERMVARTNCIEFDQIRLWMCGVIVSVNQIVN